MRRGRDPGSIMQGLPGRCSQFIALSFLVSLLLASKLPPIDAMAAVTTHYPPARLHILDTRQSTTLTLLQFVSRERVFQGQSGLTCAYEIHNTAVDSHIREAVNMTVTAVNAAYCSLPSSLLNPASSVEGHRSSGLLSNTLTDNQPSQQSVPLLVVLQQGRLAMAELEVLPHPVIIHSATLLSTNPGTQQLQPTRHLLVFELEALSRDTHELLSQASAGWSLEVANAPSTVSGFAPRMPPPAISVEFDVSWLVGANALLDEVTLVFQHEDTILGLALRLHSNSAGFGTDATVFNVQVDQATARVCLPMGSADCEQEGFVRQHINTSSSFSRQYMDPSILQLSHNPRDAELPAVPSQAITNLPQLESAKSVQPQDLVGSTQGWTGDEYVNSDSKPIIDNQQSTDATEVTEPPRASVPPSHFAARSLISAVTGTYSTTPTSEPPLYSWLPPAFFPSPPGSGTETPMYSPLPPPTPEPPAPYSDSPSPPAPPNHEPAMYSPPPLPDGPMPPPLYWLPPTYHSPPPQPYPSPAPPPNPAPPNPPSTPPSTDAPGQSNQLPPPQTDPSPAPPPSPSPSTDPSLPPAPSPPSPSPTSDLQPPSPSPSPNPPSPATSTDFLPPAPSPPSPSPSLDQAPNPPSPLPPSPSPSTDQPPNPPSPLPPSPSPTTGSQPPSPNPPSPNPPSPSPQPPSPSNETHQPSPPPSPPPSPQPPSPSPSPLNETRSPPSPPSPQPSPSSAPSNETRPPAPPQLPPSPQPPSPSPSPSKPPSPPPSPPSPPPKPAPPPLPLDTPRAALSGRAYDGYLDRCVVFLDTNNDAVLDRANEIFTTSSRGDFSLAGVPLPLLNHTIVRLLHGTNCTDIASGMPLENDLAAPTNGNGNIIISPMSTLLVSMLEDGIEEDVARAAIRGFFGLSRKHVTIGQTDAIWGAATGTRQLLRYFGAEQQLAATVQQMTVLLKSMLKLSDDATPGLARGMYRALSRVARGAGSRRMALELLNSGAPSSAMSCDSSSCSLDTGLPASHQHLLPTPQRVLLQDNSTDDEEDELPAAGSLGNVATLTSVFSSAVSAVSESSGGDATASLAGSSALLQAALAGVATTSSLIDSLISTGGDPAALLNQLALASFVAQSVVAQQLQALVASGNLEAFQAATSSSALATAAATTSLAGALVIPPPSPPPPLPPSPSPPSPPLPSSPAPTPTSSPPLPSSPAPTPTPSPPLPSSPAPTHAPDHPTSPDSDNAPPPALNSEDGGDDGTDSAMPPPAPTRGDSTPPSPTDPLLEVHGKAVDGYLRNCRVFVERPTGTAPGDISSTVTNEAGDWTLSLPTSVAAAAPLHVAPTQSIAAARSVTAVTAATECHDVTTWLKLIIPLSAPPQSRIISPVTTLWQLAAAAGNLTSAEGRHGLAQDIQAMLGVAASVDLGQDDPAAALGTAPGTAALRYFGVEQAVSSLLTQMAAIASEQEANQTAFAGWAADSLARILWDAAQQQVASSSVGRRLSTLEQLSLSDTAVLGVLLDGTMAAALANGHLNDTQLAVVDVDVRAAALQGISNAMTLIEQAIQAGASARDVAAAAYVAQTQVSVALRQLAATSNTTAFAAATSLQALSSAAQAIRLPLDDAPSPPPPRSSPPPLFNPAPVDTQSAASSRGWSGRHRTAFLCLVIILPFVAFFALIGAAVRYSQSRQAPTLRPEQSNDGVSDFSDLNGMPCRLPDAAPVLGPASIGQTGSARTGAALLQPIGSDSVS